MRKAFSILLSVVFSVSASAQLWERLTDTPVRIDTNEVQTLRLEVDNISFFRDNEYKSKLTKGYSLPGLWVRPTLQYTPHKAIRLEAGFHALVFNGANKYPCYAYHDIGTWKGDQYQSGAHILPWFRAQVELGCVDLVFGNIYGGELHQLMTPLWNSETNLSQDPEMGIQVRWANRFLQSHTWLNWQSYIFEEDTHQEAFTIGSSWRFLLNNPEASTHWYVPLQIVAHHRGGEQDTTHLGTQTLTNFAAGVGMKQRIRSQWLKQISAEVDALASWQMKGHLWPFTQGFAVHGAVEARLWDALNVKIGHFAAPSNFVSLYGSPFFTTVSQRENGYAYDGLQTTYARIDYHYTIASHYTIGADCEVQHSWLGDSPAGKRNETNFSFGVYLRANPSFLLKRFRR